jgi:RHS repeat-associated protein
MPQDDKALETEFYNYFRDYDPSLGRYVESDPIGLRGGISTYAYALGSPASLIDPLGLEVTMTCRPVTAFGKMGLSKPVHCGVFVWHREKLPCEKCSIVIDAQFSLPGGASSPTTDSTNDTYVNDRRAFMNPSSSDLSYLISVPPGMGQAQFDAAVIGKGKGYSQGPYMLPGLGPNSNTCANSIIEQAGGTTPDVPGAWSQRYKASAAYWGPIFFGSGF